MEEDAYVFVRITVMYVRRMGIRKKLFELVYIHFRSWKISQGSE